MLRHVVSVLLSRGVLKAFNFITLLLLVRVLNVDDYGLYGVFSSAILVAISAGNMGLRQSGAYLLGSRKVESNKVLSGMAALWPVGSVVGVLVMIGLSSGLWRDPPWMFVFFFAAVFSISASLVQGVFLGTGNIASFNWVELIPKILLLLFVLILWSFNALTALTASASLALGYALTTVYGLRMVARDGFAFSHDSQARTDLLKEGWKYSVALTFIVVNERVGVFLLAETHGAVASGKYFAVLQLNQILLETASAVGLVLFSKGARADDPKSTLLSSARLSRWLIWIVALCSWATIPFFPVIVPMFLGNEYLEIIPTLSVLIVGIPVLAFCKLIYPAMAGLGWSGFGAMAYGAFFIINLLCSLVFVRSFGALGVAASLCLSYLGIACAFLYFIHKEYGLSPFVFLVPTQSDMNSIRAEIRRRFKGTP